MGSFHKTNIKSFLSKDQWNTFLLSGDTNKQTMGHYDNLLCEEIIFPLHKGKKMDWGTKSSFFPDSENSRWKHTLDYHEKALFLFPFFFFSKSYIYTVLTSVKFERKKVFFVKMRALNKLHKVVFAPLEYLFLL